eukprot:11628026-Karenia_brevis.AAC.1
MRKLSQEAGVSCSIMSCSSPGCADAFLFHESLKTMSVWIKLSSPPPRPPVAVARATQRVRQSQT